MLISSLVLGIIGIKSAITTALSMAFGLSLANAQQTGLITSQGGEFAFVAFGLAKSLGILDPTMTKVMLTSVSLTMALTPLLASLSGKVRQFLFLFSLNLYLLKKSPSTSIWGFVIIDC
jgi:CPA2 family monovalent cation:H+ antiporter-2